MAIDPKTLSQIRSIGGDDLLGRLVGLFLENTPVRLEEIRRGIAAGDMVRASKAVHSLRSSSVTLGATELADMAADLEQMANREEGQALEAALPALEEKTAAVVSSLQRMSATLS